MKLGTSMSSQRGTFLVADEAGQLICHPERLRAYVRGLPARGIEHFEFSWEVQEPMLALFGGDLRAFLSECQSSLGLTFSVHLLHIGVDIASPYLEQARVAAEEQAKILRCTRDLGITEYVLHIGKTIGSLWDALTDRSPALRDHLWEGSLRSAHETIPRLLREVEPRRVAVENLENIPFDLIEPLVQEYDLGLCFDVGHAFLSGLDCAEFFRLHQERITTIHFHDVKGAGQPLRKGRLRDHNGLGLGSLDYQSLLDVFLKANYTGRLVLEILTPEEEAASVDLCRNYLLAKGVVASPSRIAEEGGPAPTRHGNQESIL